MLSHAGDREAATCGALVRAHIGDWIVTIIVAVVGALITLISPFRQFFDPTDARLAYPLKDNSVPSWAVPIIGLLSPAVICVAMFLYQRAYSASFVGPKERHQLHRYLLSLCLTNAITFLITNAIKTGVGQPRPNFIAMTGWTAANGFTKSSSDVNQAFSAFPSGHSSMTSCGMTFLFLVLVATFNKPSLSLQPNQTWRTIVCFFPWVVTILVMCSRLTDYWHDYTDVIAGALIGSGVSWFVYRQHAMARQPRRKLSADQTAIVDAKQPEYQQSVVVNNRASASPAPSNV